MFSEVWNAPSFVTQWVDIGEEKQHRWLRTLGYVQ